MTNIEMHRMIACSRDTNIRVVKEAISGDIDQQEAYVSQRRRLRLLAEEISAIPMDQLPLFINSEDEEYRKMVLWRLEHGV